MYKEAWESSADYSEQQIRIEALRAASRVKQISGDPNPTKTMLMNAESIAAWLETGER